MSIVASTPNDVLDIAGCGFGPANLALAIALEENGPGTGRQMFFERQERFGWHRGMLLEGATLQVSFLKDLVTMRNPTSGYSFVAYLHAVGRLPDFINGKTLYPLRMEYHDYIEWAAERLSAPVTYGAVVEAIRPVAADGFVKHLDLVVRTGEGLSTYRARNVVIGTGLTPHLPPDVTESERILHSERLLDRIPGIKRLRPRRIVVVGAGQSAAEVVDYLHQRFTRTEVCAVFSRYGYSAADDTPFTNRIFDPEAVDTFYAAPGAAREALLNYHRNTNYSVVDSELAQELYRRFYQEKVLGHRRLRIINTARVEQVEEHEHGVRLTVDHLLTNVSEVMDADAVIYATGYRPTDPTPLLANLAADCKWDANGRLQLERDYQVLTSDTVRCGIYLHGGGAEHSHGIGAGLLSNTATRAGEIAQSLIDRLA
ncbi:lysine N(6)-hydroxylase/L-ornithine N(5)-oxygenase family protein [Streptosporangium nondiastaticum]|uniref:lysine N(6)-hydroxylase/L-ornithine N(5)-oxygenase family protein n=1 Tax=Streptosporangium nondiastaticum TaxID=35764 RepID=UPI0031F92971